MSIIQKIKYNSNNTYFSGFLQTLIDESEIRASVEQKDGEIVLKIDSSDEAKVNEFNTLVSKYLPHSIFLDEIETIQSDEEVKTSNFTSKDYNISPCPKCIELVSDPSSPNYLDENIVCNHYSNDGVQTYNDPTIFSPHFSEDCTVLLCDATKINELFIISEDEIKALFSIEKPTIKVTIKDETLKELVGGMFVKVKTPYNLKSVLASINAKESGVSYLFFYQECDLDAVIVQKNLSIIKANRVAKELENLDSDSVLNRFLNIKKEAGFGKSAIGTYLSTKGISFIVSNEVGTKKVISFGEFDLVKTLENFKADEKRARLLENLNAKFPTVVEKLESKNLGLFEAIATILELENLSFDGLSNKGYEFRGNAGLKVDMNFSDEGFDYESFLGSIISFKLAGVDTHYLAYSIFEAYGDMAITVMSQLKTKFKIENFIIMGNMFSNSVLYSRILSKFQLNNPYFSKAIALDE